MIKFFIFIVANCAMASSDISTALKCLKSEGITIRATSDTENETGTVMAELQVPVPENPRSFCFVQLAKGWTDQAGKKTYLKTNKGNDVICSAGRLSRTHAHQDSVITDVESNSFFSLETKPEGVFFKMIKRPVHTISGLKFYIDKYYPSIIEYVEKIKGMPLSSQLNQRAKQIFIQQSPGICQAFMKYYDAKLINIETEKETEIPRATHTIVLNEQDLNGFSRLRRSIQAFSTTEKWYHFIWTVDSSIKIDVPSDLKGKVVVRSIDCLSDITPKEKEAVRRLLAIDSRSVHCFLSALIPAKIGGWSIAPNVEIAQSPDRFSKATFLAFIDDIYCPILTMLFFGSKKNNPILLMYLSIIMNATLDKPFDFKCGEYNHLFSYGEYLFTKCALSSLEEGNLIFPGLLLPTYKDSKKSLSDRDVTMSQYVIGSKFGD